MSNRRSDAELIRICLEGSVDDLSESVFEEISERVQESPLLEAAIRESPHAAIIQERVAANSTNTTAERSGDVSSRVVWRTALLLVVVAIGAGVWWSRLPDNVGPETDLQPESDSAIAIADSEGDSTLNSTHTRQRSKASVTPAATGVNVESADADTDSNKTVSATSPDDVEPASGNAIDAESTGKTVPAQASKSNSNSDATAEVASAVDESSQGTTEGPWQTALSLETPPHRFEETAWQVPGTEHPDQYPPTEFQSWFSRVSGKPFQLSEEKVSNRVFTGFNGIARLKAPWLDSAVLRIGLYDAERCSLTVWSGLNGIKLRYYRHRNPHVWAAYSVRRAGLDGDAALPRVGRFLNSDCGRWHRSSFGVFDVRWDNGYLRLVRGDVVLLAVPFESPPGEIMLDGKMKLREVRMFRSDPLPEYVTQPSDAVRRPNVLTTTRPADLQWTTTDTAEGAFTSDMTTGLVRLTTGSKQEQRALAFTELTDAGLSEFIFRVKAMDPGTGIYFGRADGSQIFRISCLWDTAAGRPALWFQSAGQHEVERRFDPEGYVAPWTGSDQWIRVVAGYGITTVQVSPDGQHWGWIIDNPSRTDWERIETAGLFAEPKGDRQIQLSHISINEFSSLVAAADPELVTKVNRDDFQPLNVLDVGAWLQKTFRNRPQNVSFDQWRRACAVATLRGRPRAPLGTFLINGLLSDGAFSESTPSSPDDIWDMLYESSQLISPLDHNRAVQFQQLYHEVARRQVAAACEQFWKNARTSDDSDSRLHAIIREAASRLLTNPMQTHQAASLTPQTAVRLAAVSLLHSGHADKVRQLIDETVFWNSNAHPGRDWWSQVDPLYPTLAWAELRSHVGLNAEVQTARLALPRRWKTTLTPERHPLAQPVSKEAYNVMAEFQAAIDGAAFQDACQVISSAGSANLIGLLPDSRDDQLLVSFPNAVAMAMNQHPQLRQQMNERFGAIGRLRVRQAIENGDFRQVEAATVQFFGTPAAAESDLWLGDRAMSAGQFAQARSYFERAVSGFQMNSQIESTEIAAASARLQMASALLGESPPNDSDVTVARSVSFGNHQLTSQQFSGLVNELAESQSRRTVAGTSLSQSSVAVNGFFDAPRIPIPVVHRIENRGRYEGDLGEHVGRSVPADTDWVSRQLGWTIVGDLAYLNNRFQISCLDLTNGSIKWNQQLGGDHGSAHHWPMLAMRPMVTGDVIFCRRLTKSGTELSCCQTADGKMLWREQYDQLLVSDPFLLRGKLQILSTDQSSIGPAVLNLLTVQRETGSILATMPLLKLFDAWQNTAPVCQVAVQDAQVFLSTAGAVACCNNEGQTLWVRRRDWTPTNLDSRHRYARSWSVPMIVDGRLIVGQPESPTIDCLDVSTGRLIWKHIEPELRRIISHDNRKLLIETRDGLKSLSTETGETRWMYAASDLLDGVLVGPLTEVAESDGDQTGPRQPDCLLAVRHVPKHEGRSSTAIPTLVWINAETGKEFARQRLAGLTDKEARVGPLLMTETRMFAFSGKDRKEGRRDIIELIPETSQNLPGPVNQTIMAAWHPEFQISSYPDNEHRGPDLVATSLQRESRNAIDELCPGWMLISPLQPGGMGQRDEHRGQKSVLELKLQPRNMTPEEQQALAATPVHAIRFIRDVSIPADGDQSFRFKAGINSGQPWNLTIDANGQQIHSTVVNDETAPSGWTLIQTSLRRWSGRSVRVMITCSLADEAKQTSIFLSELNSSALTRRRATD